MARQSRLPDLDIVLEIQNVHKARRPRENIHRSWKDELVPSPFHPDVHHAVIKAVKKAH